MKNYSDVIYCALHKDSAVASVIMAKCYKACYDSDR